MEEWWCTTAADSMEEWRGTAAADPLEVTAELKLSGLGRGTARKGMCSVHMNM